MIVDDASETEREGRRKRQNYARFVMSEAPKSFIKRARERHRG